MPPGGPLTQLPEEQGHAAATDGEGGANWGLDHLPVACAEGYGPLGEHADWNTFGHMGMPQCKQEPVYQNLGSRL